MITFYFIKSLNVFQDCNLSNNLVKDVKVILRFFFFSDVTESTVFFFFFTFLFVNTIKKN